MFARPGDNYRDNDRWMDREERGGDVLGEVGGSDDSGIWLPCLSSTFLEPSRPSSEDGSSVDLRRLLVQVHIPSSFAREEFLNNLFRLFDIAPGLIHFRCQPIRSLLDMEKVLVEYNTRQNALYAMNKLNGFEYPSGQRLSVLTTINDGHGLFGDFPQTKPDFHSSPRADESSGLPTSPSDQLSQMTAVLAKATGIISSYVLQAKRNLPDRLNKRETDSTFDRSYCSVRLPSPQPLVQTRVARSSLYRLFIVCEPCLPPEYSLTDIFCRFGNLVEVYTIPAENCGYVTYATQESAEKAISTLHFQKVCGMRIKLMVDGTQYERPRIKLENGDQ